MTTAIEGMAITTTTAGMVAAITMSLDEEDGLLEVLLLLLLELLGGGVQSGHLLGGNLMIIEVIDLLRVTREVTSSVMVATVFNALQLKYSQVLLAAKSTQMS